MADKHNIIYGLLKTQKEVYKLVKERISIGRNRNSQIVINNNTVSKEHAIIEFDEDYNATIKDLNSSNGTYVNGERLKFMPIKLKTGDKITFGKEKTEYIFESFNMNNDSKTEADMNQYMFNGNNMDINDNKMIYDQKINLVNENEMSFARMNHFQNNNRNYNFNNNNNLNNGSYNNNLKNGINNRDYENEEDNNNDMNNNDYNNLEQTYKNKIEELEKRNTELESEKEDLSNKNNELNREINTKIEELKKMTTLFDELNIEYSKLNSKHNALMKYSSDIQKKLDLSSIELSQIKKKSHGNEDTDKIINQKDNIISILQNEVNYYKKLSGKNNNINFNTFPSNDINNNHLSINNKLDSLIDKYISENKKLKQQNDSYKKKFKLLQKKGINNKNNIDFEQFEIQMNYQIDNFNNIINEYNQRLSDSLNKISELFEQSKKEEAAKYLVEQVNDFMQENQRLISENTKLNTQILELQAQLTSQNNLNFNSINQNQVNNMEENDIDIEEINNEEEIDELKNKIDDLENVIRKLKIGNNNINENNLLNTNLNNNNIREAFVNALNELKEKDILINELQNKIKAHINNTNNLNYGDSKIPIEQNSKENNGII